MLLGRVSMPDSIDFVDFLEGADTFHYTSQVNAVLHAHFQIDIAEKRPAYLILVARTAIMPRRFSSSMRSVT